MIARQRSRRARKVNNVEVSQQEEAPVAVASSFDRRSFLGRVGLVGIGAAGLASGLLSAGCGSGSGTLPVTTGTGTNPTPTPTVPASGLPVGFTDADILNFALNLEYLEAEYYLRGVTGSGLTASESGGTGTVTGGRAVSFSTPTYRQLAQEVANDERAHVNALRSALGGAAVSRPNIDFTNAFNAAAQAAGLGSSFDPFADEVSFLIGAFAFEDVGVTAYQGAAAAIVDPNTLETAAGFLSVEAYHAGAIRSLLSRVGGSALTAANAISALRSAAGGGKDQAVGSSSSINIVPADSNAIAFGRTPAEVLRIVYLTPSGGSMGGFFPSGLNGSVKTAPSV